MCVVFLLLHFLPCDEHVLTPGGNDVIPAVGGRVPYGFMFAHEKNGDARGEATKRRGGRTREGDLVPGAGIGEACLLG